MMRKKVQWWRQEVYEYFVRRKDGPWVTVDKKVGASWERGSYKYHEQHATDEEFRNRLEDCPSMTCLAQFSK